MGKEIAIRDLTFSYSGRGDQISHVTLDIRAGEVIVRLAHPEAEKAL